MPPLFLLFSAAALAAPCTQADANCMERVTVDGRHFLLVYRSHSLTGANPSIERAFVLVHGTGRDGDGYFGIATKAVREAGAADSTLVVAPQFHARDGRCKDPVERGELRFTCNGWKYGANALDGSSDSFAAMDSLLALLAGRARFPNLKEIVLAGHSAGGQYVQRYAAANLAEPTLGIPVRHMVANPSSYVYLDSWRPAPSAACAAYDEYKFGLTKLAGYAARTGAAKIREQYPQRNVTYLLGELDTTNEFNLDTSCGAMTQGPNRLERGLAYARHLATTTGAKHEVLRVPGCGHSSGCMFRSPAALRAIFGSRP